MNEQETKELFGVLIVETKRQRGIGVTEKDNALVRQYDLENGKMYNQIVDYVETWIRKDAEKYRRY